MAVYNGKRYIIEQMDSIRTQTITVDEVIISNNFSSDETEKIGSAYIDKYLLNNSCKQVKKHPIQWAWQETSIMQLAKLVATLLYYVIKMMFS